MDRGKVKQLKRGRPQPVSCWFQFDGGVCLFICTTYIRRLTSTDGWHTGWPRQIHPLDKHFNGSICATDSYLQRINSRDRLQSCVYLEMCFRLRWHRRTRLGAGIGLPLWATGALHRCKLLVNVPLVESWDKSWKLKSNWSWGEWVARNCFFLAF